MRSPLGGGEIIIKPSAARSWTLESGMDVWDYWNETHSLESLVEVIQQVDIERLQSLALEGGGDVGEEESLSQ